jgi:hypothetical protein
MSLIVPFNRAAKAMNDAAAQRSQIDALLERHKLFATYRELISQAIHLGGKGAVHEVASLHELRLKTLEQITDIAAEAKLPEARDELVKMRAKLTLPHILLIGLTALFAKPSEETPKPTR